MKEFNLDAALNGEPVMLRNGCKAIVYYIIPEEYTFPDGTNSTYPLRGLIFDKDGFIENSFYFWFEDGRCNRECYKSNDIIGMWEEPKKQIGIDDLPKPFKPKEDDEYFYINGGIIEYESEFWNSSNFDIKASKRGGCFRTKEDAQKWLDFMKSMLE